jgi:hypothetical protein
MPDEQGRGAGDGLAFAGEGRLDVRSTFARRSLDVRPMHDVSVQGPSRGAAGLARRSKAAPPSESASDGCGRGLA